MGKLGYDKGKIKDDKQNLLRNLDHITCNDCGEKFHYAGNSEFSKQKNTKEDVESFRKSKQGKYGNNPTDGGG